MHKFTPGPWEVVDADDVTPSHHIIPVNSNGYGHAGDRYMRVGGCIDIYDAQLIAAAPELLDALKDVISWVPSANAWHTDAPTKAVEKALAAIAKATGEPA